MPRKTPPSFGLAAVASLSDSSPDDTEWLPTMSTESIADRPSGIDEHPKRTIAIATRTVIRAPRAQPFSRERRGACWKAFTMLAAAACFGFAMACTASLPHPPYTAQLSSALVQVDTPPPPGRVEILPARPNLTAVWLDGEWTWRRGRWAWMPGRWVNSPSGFTFSPWVFVRAPDGGLWYAPGAWHDSTGSAVPAPAPQAVAAVDS